MAFGVAELLKYFGLFGLVFGIGQGGMEGPSGWSYIVDIILKYYECLAHRCLMQDPTKPILQKANSDMFVNDASHHHNDKNKNIMPVQLIQK
eukprot:15354346-Ditylum_brightwellii.AAC.1